MSNRFENHLAAKRILDDANRAITQKTNDYLLEASLNFKGSALKLLLNRGQTQICREFMALMAEHDYPGAVELKLERKTKLSVLSPEELSMGSWHYGIKSKLANSLAWRKLWLGQAYLIGVLARSSGNYVTDTNSTAVYLCHDLKLRCARSSPVFGVGQSYTHGVGAIPSKLLSQFSFQIGCYAKSYNESSTMDFIAKDLEKMFLDLSELLLVDKLDATRS